MMKSTDTLHQVQIQIDETQQIMRNNITKALDMSEHMEHLEESSERLANDANIFARGAKKLRCQMCKRYYKLLSIIIFVLGFIITVVVVTR